MRAAVLAGMALVLGGCASHIVSIRRVPAQTPAADNAAAAANAAAFAEAAAAEPGNDSGQEAQEAPSLLTPADAPPMYTYDPWERLNRFTYRFNARFDEAIFLPVADTYRRAPRPIRAGVHNFFGNLTEVDSIINYTLQWRLKYGLRSLERLAINSTIGIGGLFDALSRDPVARPFDPSGRRRLCCRLWGGIWHQHCKHLSRQRLVGVAGGQWDRSTRQHRLSLLFRRLALRIRNDSIFVRAPALD